MPPLFAQGWMVTTVSGIDVESQFAVFGLSGSFTFIRHRDKSDHGPLVPAGNAATDWRRWSPGPG
jgi:hypothetical protein